MSATLTLCYLHLHYHYIANYIWINQPVQHCLLFEILLVQDSNNTNHLAFVTYSIFVQCRDPALNFFLVSCPCSMSMALKWIVSEQYSHFHQHNYITLTVLQQYEYTYQKHQFYGTKSISYILKQNYISIHFPHLPNLF